MMKGNQKKDKGYALMTVLIFFTVLLIIGLGLGYVTQKGYLSVSAEAKFAKAEKLANIGLLTVIENGTCGNFSAEGINVITLKDSANKNCLVWSEGIYKGARVVKTAVFSLWGSNWGAALFKNLDLSGVGGSAAIVGYDSPENNCTDPNSCIAPALVTGNKLNPGNFVIACYTNPNNLGRGIISTVEPYKYDPDLANKDLTEMLFNAKDRTEMLVKFSEIFKVKFDDGRPVGIENPEFSGNFQSCDASGTTITCDGNTFIWNGTHYVYNGQGYKSIDFGQNAQIIIQGTFTGGGIIAGKDIIFQGNVNSISLALIAKDKIDMSFKSADQITVNNTFMFAKNYIISAKNMKVENSFFYSGGENGELNINLDAGTKLGTQDYPILIISDNKINVQRNGNSEIWGVIFATEANNNFNIGSGNGDFKIHGSVISNSLNNNNININGNFEIRFNFKTIEKLYTNLSNLGFNFLKYPVCGANKGKLFKLTGMRVY